MVREKVETWKTDNSIVETAGCSLADNISSADITCLIIIFFLFKAVFSKQLSMIEKIKNIKDHLKRTVVTVLRNEDSMLEVFTISCRLDSEGLTKHSTLSL